MDNDNFERLIANEIIESIQNHPEDWTTSIMGLKRKSDNLDLSFSSIGRISSVKIYRPNEYEFKNEKIHEQLAQVVKTLYDELMNKLISEKEIKNKEELAKFFDLNNRKHKLEALKEISEERYDEQEEETVKEEIVKEEIKEEEVKPKKRFWFW